MILICNRSRAARIKRRDWSGVLTFADPSQREVLRFHKWPHPEHQVIRCEDLDEPTAGFVTPTVDQVERVIEFGRKHATGRLLIHCNAGISRSTAAGLAILADRLGAGREADALAAMIELRHEGVPNLLMVQYADDLLGRSGALLRVVREWDTPRAWNQWRRHANRIVTLDPTAPLPPMPEVDA